MRPLLLTITLLGTLPAAPAAAAWSPPAQVSESASGSLPLVAFDAERDALFAWSNFDVGARARTVLVPRPGRERIVRGQLLDLVPATGRELLLLRRDGEKLLLSRAVTVGTAVEAARTVGTTRGSQFADIASDTRGNAVIAWADTVQGKPQRRPSGVLVGPPPTTTVRIRVRTSNGRLGRAHAIRTTSDVSRIHVAFGSRGRYAVTWSERDAKRRRAVRATFGRIGGRLPSRDSSVRVGSHRGYADLAAAVRRDGTLTVVYGTQDTGEEANVAYEVRAVTVNARGFHVAAQRLALADKIERTPARVSLAPLRDGRVVALYTAPLKAGDEVRAVVADRGRFGAAQTLATNAAAGAVTPDGDGGAVAVWQRWELSPAEDTPVQAAVLHPTAAQFGPAETLGRGANGRVPYAAVEPRSGEVTAVWAALAEQTGTVAGRRAVVLASTRPGA